MAYLMYIYCFFLLYQIIQLSLFPIIFSYIIFRRIYKQKYSALSFERFGFIQSSPKNRKVIWIHAASVGEALSTEYLISLIKKEIPDSYCYLTVGTEFARDLFDKNKKADKVCFLPYDFLPCMILAYYRINPASLIIIESELWPNLVMLAHFKNINIFGLNYRISKRSSFLKRIIINPIFAKFLMCYEKIFVQTKTDAGAFVSMGINEKKVVLLGDLKAYNVSQKKEQAIKLLPSKNLATPVLLVGSMHPGELNYYINLFKKLKPLHPDLKLIMAPRHFHWKKELSKALYFNNLRFFIWDENNKLPTASTLIQQLELIFLQNDIFVVCVMGELFNLYRFADIFFLGGTFVPIGGHNLLEPAAWSIPTIIGPHHENCKEIANSLEKIKALFVANSEDELFERTNIFLNSCKDKIIIKKNISSWIANESSTVKQALMELIEIIKKGATKK